MDRLTAGDHSVVFSYQTVNGGIHALDYLGSYDATETTSPHPGPLHANNNNPCHDWLGTGEGSGCTPIGTPPVPASTFRVPRANLAAQKTACMASGVSQTPTQVRGRFSLFAPADDHASLTGASYVSQNEGTGSTCTTTVRVDFRDEATAPGNDHRAVLAFGGRIASALDWGPGNSASSISGASFHVTMVEIDGVGIGGQTLTMSTATVAPFASIATQVSHAAIVAGSTLTDTATLTGVSPFGHPAGTVQFRLCRDTTDGCPQSTGEDIGGLRDLTPATTPANTSTATSLPFGSNLAPGDYCVGVVFTHAEDSFYSSTYHGSPQGECFTVVPRPVGLPVVSAGYADGLEGRDTAGHPNPWQGSSGVIFEGCNFYAQNRCPTASGHLIYDAGALLLVNDTATPEIVTDASVTIGMRCHFAPWPGLEKVVQPGESLILTETGGPPPCPGPTGGAYNFDTSETNLSATKCTMNDGLVPVFHVKVSNEPVTYLDNEQVLNTDGMDPGAVECGLQNETHNWVPMTHVSH